MHWIIALSGDSCCIAGVDKQVELKMEILALENIDGKNVNSGEDNRERLQYSSWIGGILHHKDLFMH